MTWPEFYTVFWPRLAAAPDGVNIPPGGAPWGGKAHQNWHGRALTANVSINVRFFVQGGGRGVSIDLYAHDRTKADWRAVVASWPPNNLLGRAELDEAAGEDAARASCILRDGQGAVSTDILDHPAALNALCLQIGNAWNDVEGWARGVLP